MSNDKIEFYTCTYYGIEIPKDGDEFYCERC
jgi:hypothetical protein